MGIARHLDPKPNSMRSLFMLLYFFYAVGHCCHAQKTIEYCANIGPVLFSFDKDSVSGSYLITVTPEPIEGKIKGTIKDGLLDAVWIDREGTGRIIFGFSGDRNRFSAFFNTKANPTNWTGTWRATSKDVLKDLPVKLQGRFYCEWKGTNKK